MLRMFATRLNCLPICAENAGDAALTLPISPPLLKSWAPCRVMFSGGLPTEEEQRHPQLGRVLLRRAIAYGIFLRLAFRPVVPANAGTHTARILVSALEQRPFSIFEAMGDGVPAFAGTTR